MLNTDRGGIKDSLKEWSQRKNIADTVWNDFIELALSKANRALRIPPCETFSALTVSETGYLELPSNFIEVKELKIQVDNNTIILDRKSIHEVDDVSNLSTIGCDPSIFGRSGNYLRIAPWSGGEGLATLYYFAALPPLVDDTSTNWFTQYAPEILLYGAMDELASYTRDTEGSALWRAKFNEAVDILQSMEDRAEWRGNTLGVTLAGSTGRRI
jgi:hypothetical protein